MPARTKQLNPMVILSLMMLLLGLFYVLEVNAIIHDSFRIEIIKKHMRDVALQSQSLAARSAVHLSGQSMEQVKVRFSLIEVKVFTYIEPKTAQFSLKGYRYE